jgi:hypothetical protein
MTISRTIKAVKQSIFRTPSTKVKITPVESGSLKDTGESPAIYPPVSPHRPFARLDGLANQYGGVRTRISISNHPSTIEFQLFPTALPGYGYWSSDYFIRVRGKTFVYYDLTQVHEVLLTSLVKL